MIVYKYLSSKYWKSVLKDSLIRFSPPSVFNDPFEMQPFYESLALDPNVQKQLTEENAGSTLKELLKQALPNVPPEVRALVTADKNFLDNFADIIAPLTAAYSTPILEKVTSSIGEGIYSGLDKNVGVLSLCERFDDLLMWAHYGEQHKGMVIGFDSNDGFFDQRLNEHDDFRHLRPVQYTQIRPTMQFARDDEMSQILLTKSDEWSYEEEWRMLLPLAHAEKKFDVKGECVSLFKIPHQSIVEIIIGCRMPNTIKQRIEKFVLRDNRYSHAKLFVAELDNKEFKLRFKELKRD